MSERQEGDGKVAEEDDAGDVDGGEGRKQRSTRGGDMARNKHNPN